MYERTRELCGANESYKALTDFSPLIYQAVAQPGSSYRQRDIFALVDSILVYLTFNKIIMLSRQEGLALVSLLNI